MERSRRPIANRQLPIAQRSSNLKKKNINNKKQYDQRNTDYWNGYIEKVGTGTEDIITKCHDYGLQTPEFHQEEDFRVVIWRNKSGSTPQVTPYDTPYVTPQVKTLLKVLGQGAMNRKELMEKIGLKDVKYFTQYYLQPALLVGVVEMTIPDKPKSKNQSYRLTEKGKNY